MAVDMFLKIEGIKGEAQDHKHKDEVDVLSWSWGMTQSGTMHMGGGGGSGKVNVQDLSVTKYVDSASHALMLNCCNGKHIPEATLCVRKAGGKGPVEYIKITMKEIIVTSVASAGSGGEDRLTESITLNFSHYKYEYTPQKQDGSPDAPKTTTWNIAKNTAE